MVGLRPYAAVRMRQTRTEKAQLWLVRRKRQSQASLQEMEHRPACPSLGRTCYRILGRSLSRTAGETAEQLGQAMQVYANARLQQAGEDLKRLVLESVAGKSHGDDTIVMRPN